VKSEKSFSFILKTQVRKEMVRMLMMAGLVVGAYVAGYNGVTHVEVVEFVEWSMANVEEFNKYVEGMMEYAENMKNNVEGVL
jgi:hypothetical protein